MTAVQKPKAIDTTYTPPALARDGKTSLLAGTQVLRAQHHFSTVTIAPTATGAPGATVMSDVVHSNDAVEPTWADRQPTDPDLSPVFVVAGASNGPR